MYARAWRTISKRKPHFDGNVRFGSKADMCSAQADVRFVPIADFALVNLTIHRGIPDDGITSPFALVIYL